MKCIFPSLEKRLYQVFPAIVVDSEGIAIPGSELELESEVEILRGKSWMDISPEAAGHLHDMSHLFTPQARVAYLPALLRATLYPGLADHIQYSLPLVLVAIQKEELTIDQYMVVREFIVFYFKYRPDELPFFRPIIEYKHGIILSWGL
jgi:hypothetical protein